MTGTPPEPDGRRQVGLLIEPSADFAVALFGAWTAGLGILPLPAEFPDARLRVMVEDCRPLAVLASGAQAERARRLVAGSDDVRVLTLDASQTWDAPDPANGEPGPAADHPAFTVYTSGSTGRPKGVVIRAAQVAELVAWEARAWRLGPWVRMAQTLSLGFDFGLQELFSTLPFGGSLVVPDPAERRDARRYAAFLARERITVLFTTPSFADELAATGQTLPDLRLILIGGEVLHWSTVRALEKVVAPECRLINGYGPTEATVNCLAYDIPRDAARTGAGESEIVPVGRASASSLIHLLDQHGLPVPVGAVGQISIGGPGVADGYLHRPDLTAERFVPGPGGATGDDGTVYRSGDLAYLRHDGEFVVIGRGDRQVKLRGYRVEPAEVEWALRELPGVTAAAVRIVGTPARAVAVVAGTATVRAVLDGLAARLPAPMVPDRVVVLDQMPLTANGKLDHAAVRALAEDVGRNAAAPDASTAQIEQTICRVWGAVLGRETVHPGRNVFDEGGHSLAATQAHGRLQALLGMPFPVADLFEYPCPSDLAEQLAAYRRQPRPDTEPSR